MRSKTSKAASSGTGSLQEQISAARADLADVQSRLEAIALDEQESLATDASYIAWTRRRRLAESEYQRLSNLIISLDAQIVADQEAKAMAAFEARYNAAADRNDAVAELFRKALPEAWDIIAHVLEQAALAEIESENVRRAMPPNFHPKRWLGDPDRSVRCRPPMKEKIISETTVDRWVDKKTGNIFANQTSPPTDSRAFKRKFREVSYTPFRPSGDVAPFYRELTFPRIGNAGGPVFDGSKINTAREVLAELAKSRAVVNEPPMAPLKRIEPL